MCMTQQFHYSGSFGIPNSSSVNERQQLQDSAMVQSKRETNYLFAESYTGEDKIASHVLSSA